MNKNHVVIDLQDYMSLVKENEALKAAAINFVDAKMQGRQEAFEAIKDCVVCNTAYVTEAYVTLKLKDTILENIITEKLMETMTNKKVSIKPDSFKAEENIWDVCELDRIEE